MPMRYRPALQSARQHIIRTTLRGRVMVAVALLALAFVLLLSVKKATAPKQAAGGGPSADLLQPVAAKQKRDPLAMDLEKRLAQDIRPLMKKYCYECHANGKKRAGSRSTARTISRASWTPLATGRRSSR